MTLIFKHCTACKYMEFSQSERGYSDLTPGTTGSIYCQQGHWHIDMFDDTQETFAMKLATAQDCKDFVLAKHARVAEE